jgi:DNA primase
MPDSDEFVTVFESDSQAQVMIVKMALWEADVPFMCSNDVISTVLPIDGMAVVSFRVLERDAARARQVLDDLGFA